MSPTPPAQPKLRFAPHLAHGALVLWILFLGWAALAAVIFPLQIGDLAVQRWFGTTPAPAVPLVEMPLDDGGTVNLAPSPTAHLTGPASAVAWLLRQFDLIGVFLAFVSIYFYTVRTEGLATTRRWFALLLGGTLAVAVGNLWSGVPLGALFYSTRLGWKLFGVPLGIPLLYTTLILSAFYTVRWAFSRLAARQGAAPAVVAAISGGLIFLTSLNLERVATHFRLYWRWQTQDAAPALLWIAAVWGIVAAVLALMLRGNRPRPTMTAEPVILFASLNAVFLAVHLFA